MPTVIVKYVSGDNGKFIINCLGLGDNAIFQHKELAQQQLDNELDELQTLLTRLAQEDPAIPWKDLGMGCKVLYGFTAGGLLGNPLLDTTPNDVIAEVNRRGWYSFVVGHSGRKIKALRTVFPTEQLVELEHPYTWLFNSDLCLAYVQEVYDEIGVTGFDKEKILVYYNAYILKLQEMKRWPQYKSH